MQLLRENKITEAQTAKEEIENAQRKDAKLREMNKEKWFRKEGDKLLWNVDGSLFLIHSSIYWFGFEGFIYMEIMEI